jgi:hypothetical protein
MQRFALIASLSFGLASCSGNRSDTYVDELLKHANDVVNVSLTVRNNTSAIAAAPKLKEICNRWESFRASHRYASSSREEFDALVERHEPEVRGTAMSLYDEYQRIRQLDIKDEKFFDAWRLCGQFYRELQPFGGGKVQQSPWGN